MSAHEKFSVAVSVGLTDRGDIVLVAIGSDGEPLSFSVMAAPMVDGLIADIAEKRDLARTGVWNGDAWTTRTVN